MLVVVRLGGGRFTEYVVWWLICLLVDLFVGLLVG